MKTNLHLSPAILFILCLQFFLVSFSFASNGNAGTTIANPSSICVAQNVNLSIAGIQSGFGRTYQWQRSNNNFNWSNIAGANGANTVVNVNASAWFRCIVSSCGNSTPTQSAYVLFQNTLITSIPHDENFDASPNLPCGWTVQNANNDSRTWKISGINPRSFPRAVRYRANECQTANDWLFSPGFQLQQGLQYRVKFWYRASSCYGQEKLQVRFGQSANAGGMNPGTIFSNLQINQTSYQQAVTATFSPAQNGVFYIGFHVFSQANHSGLMIDDFSIEPIGCNVTAPVITASSGTSFCAGDSITLTSSAASGNLWSNGSTQSSIIVNQSGNYSVTVIENGCSATSNSLQVTVNPIPNVNITASGATTFCEGGSVILSSSSSQGNLWSDGSTQSTIVASQSGNYSVTLTENGCSATSNNIQITVNPIPNVDITASGATTFCEGGSVILSSSSPQGNLWSDGSTQSTIIANQSGNYSVTLTENGCSATSNNIQVTVNPIPNVNITASGATTFCEGGSVILSSSSSQGNLWSDGSTQSTIVASQSGNYSVTLSENGCSATSNNIQVTVNPIPIVNITASGSTTFCEGDSVILTSSAAQGNLWNTSETSQSIVVTATGNYAVNVTENGCSFSTNPISIIANPIPVAQIILSESPVICEGNSIQLESNSNNGNLWNNGNTNSSILVNQPGIYTLTVTENNCNSNPVSVEITVQNCVPLTSLDAGSCGNTQLTLNNNIAAQVVAGATAYEFIIRDANDQVTLANVLTNSNLLALNSIVPNLSPATNYVVRVRAMVNGIWGLQGPACTIGILPLVVSAPTTKLNSAGCGNLGLTPSSTVVAIPVVGASQYEFIVMNQNGTIYTSRIQGSASLNLSVLNPALNWGTTYAIAVKIFYAGSWGINGDTCTIGTVPNPVIFGVPLTSLRIQDCNRTNYQLNASVVAIPVAGANQYEFEFRDVNNLSVIYCSRIQTSTTLSFTNLNPVLQNTTQYSVRVRASIAGTWGQFGNVCTIGFLGTNRMENNESLVTMEEAKLNVEEVSLNVYPNPFTSELQLSLENNFQDYFYSVIDITGKEIVPETRLAGKSILLNNEMDAGVYWLRLRNQKGNFSNCRIIKQ
jgi:hypothetical protein